MHNNFVIIGEMVQGWGRFKLKLNYELIIIKLKVRKGNENKFFSKFTPHNSRFLFGFSTRYFVVNYQLLLVIEI